jgi:cell shape-determining protein MreC
MKKTFLTKRNALLSSANVSWGALALLVAVLALMLRLLAPNLFWRMSTPLLRGADALAWKSSVFFSGFADTAALVSRNEQLMNENATLASENQALQKREVDRAALAGSIPERDRRGIIASVISAPPVSPYDTLVLALGERGGVALGQEAFGAGGVPLGIVSSVLADFSRVTLFSAPNMSTRGWIGNSNLPIEILGAGGGALRATLARAAGVAVGDTVFAPGPGALPIGSVIRIDSDPSSPSVTFFIQPALNLFSVTWVELRDAPADFADSFSCAATLP